MAKKSKAKVTSKKGSKKPAKKPLARKSKSAAKPAKKKAVKAKPARKSAPVKKGKSVSVKSKKSPVKAIAKKKTKPAKKTAVKKVEAKKVVVKTKASQKPVVVPKATAKEKGDVKKKEQAIGAKAKNVPQTGKQKVDPEEKFHNKAQRIIKELEETMDIDKVKPRIKVPVFSSSKPKQVVQQKLPEPVNTGKDKYQLEFEFRSSKAILFSYLSDSSGMAGWFADEVRSSDDNFVFVWEGTEMHAKQIAVKDLQLVRYQWTDENDGTYFQFEIKEDDITSDIALLITDWAYPGEKETNRMLWENQVQRLRQLLGSL